MRLIAAALVVLVASSAWAQEFDWQKAAQEYGEAHGVCQVGLDRPIEEQEAACQKRDTLALMLRMHGLCFEKGEQEWLPCDALPK